jgi:acylaminoacyl-peptidase
MPATTGKGPHPTLLDIHGGPETQFGDTFFHEFQYWTSLGYNVVFSDPRGSVGFGYPFEAALTKSYGDAMFEDVQAVMDAAVKRPDVDASRLGVTGGSYGGYATLWVVSHTDRYKTAIAERAVDNLVSENLGADFASKNGLGGFYQWGNPWDTSSLWQTMSPINYEKNLHTPMMILHSEDDTRTPPDQTITWFTLAKVLGQKITFVDVPGETHDLNRTGAPIHRVERLHIMANWMNSYLHP